MVFASKSVNPDKRKTFPPSESKKRKTTIKEMVNFSYLRIIIIHRRATETLLHTGLRGDAAETLWVHFVQHRLVSWKHFLWKVAADLCGSCSRNSSGYIPISIRCITKVCCIDKKEKKKRGKRRGPRVLITKICAPCTN